MSLGSEVIGPRPQVVGPTVATTVAPAGRSSTRGRIPFGVQRRDGQFGSCPEQRFMMTGTTRSIHAANLPRDQAFV
jgi:hypothetical protein